MIDVELFEKMAKECGCEVKQVPEGEGGLFYPDENDNMIRVTADGIMELIRESLIVDK